MGKLIIDEDGKLTIPPHVLAKRGLRPGDELELVETAEGLLARQNGFDERTAGWWRGSSDEERRQASAEARRYISLSTEERDALWSEGAESLDEAAEADEIDLPAR